MIATVRSDSFNREIERALARTEARLVEATAAESLLVEMEPPFAVPIRTAAARWTGELCGRQSSDGSWGGDLTRTAEVLLLAAELAPIHSPPEMMQSVRLATQWIRSRQAAPGRFGDGCSPAAHAHGLCHHFLGGFFSPGPPERTQRGLRLSCGARIEEDGDARLVASCLALRALLRWGHRGTNATLHLNGLRRIVATQGRWSGGPVGPGARLVAVATLLEADRAGDRAVIELFLRILAQAQRADGSWPDADVFQVLALLEDAAGRNLFTQALGAALLRAAHALAMAQHANGTWGPDTRPRQLLIAARSLKRLLRTATMAG